MNVCITSQLVEIISNHPKQ